MTYDTLYNGVKTLDGGSPRDTKQWHVAKRRRFRH